MFLFAWKVVYWDPHSFPVLAGETRKTLQWTIDSKQIVTTEVEPILNDFVWDLLGLSAKRKLVEI